MSYASISLKNFNYDYDYDDDHFCTQRHGDTWLFFTMTMTMTILRLLLCLLNHHLALHLCWPNHPFPLLRKEGSLVTL